MNNNTTPSVPNATMDKPLNKTAQRLGASAAADAVRVFSAPATSDNVFIDIKNKLEVFRDINDKRIANSEALIADELLSAFSTNGYEGYTAARERLFGTEPVVYENDKGVGKDVANSKFAVTTIDSPESAAALQTAFNNDTVQIIQLDEGEEAWRGKHDTAWSTRNIGRDKLHGINALDKYVFYDDSTGHYYRYRNEEDADYTVLKTNIAFYKNLYEARVTQHEAMTENYALRMQKARTRTQYYRIQREYEEWYTKSAAAITEASTKLVELQQQDYTPNEDLTKRIETWLDETTAAREEMLRYGSYMADYNNPYQTNSITDVIKNTIRNSGKEGSLEMLKDDLAELLGYYAKPIQGAITNDITAKEATVALVLNALVNFGESMDIVAAPVKAAILAEAYGYNKNEAIASTLGGDWAHGNVNFDYNTGSLAMDLVLEMLSDPSTYISAFTSALPKLGAEGLTTAVVKTAKEFGVEITEKQAKNASLQALRMISTGGMDAKQAVQEALIRNLTGKDVHKVFAALDGADFKTTNSIAQHIINSPSFNSIDGLNATDIARILKNTKISEKDLNKILAVCVASRRTFDDVISGMASTLKNADEIKVALAMQKLRSLDDLYTNAVKLATVAPAIPVWKGVKGISKAVFKNVHIPPAFKGYIIELLNKCMSKGKVTEEVVASEAIITDVADAVEQLSLYAKILEGDDALAKALQDVKNEWVSITYNNVIANTVKMFNTELTYNMASGVFDKASPEDIMKLFDEIAYKVSNGKFAYAELFAFAKEGSLYAEALNSLNRQALYKLENLRSMLYTRSKCIVDNDVFKAMEQGVEYVNTALSHIFEGDTNSAYIIATYEDGVYALKALANNHKDANAREEILQTIAPLETHLTEYRASANLGELGGFNRAVAHRDAMIGALEEVYAALEKHYGEVINQVSVKEIIRATNSALGILAPTPTEALTMSVKDVIKKLFTDANAVVTDAEVEAMLVKTLSTSKVNILQNYAVVDLSNIAKNEVLFNTPKVYTAIEEILSAESPLGKVLTNAAVHGDEHIVQRVTGVLYGYALERKLFEVIEGAGLPTHVEVALKDSLAGPAINKINGIVRTTDFTSAVAVDSSTARICDILQEYSQGYMQGITQAGRNVQMYSNHVGDEVITFNSANAAQNVQNMYKHATDSSGFLAKAREAVADDSVHDIYYSIVKVSKDGNPLQVAFTDSANGETFVYKLKASLDVYNMSDDVARKMYGVDAAKCRLAAEGAPGELYNPSEMWDAIQYQLRDFATAYGQVRYVGFNAGAAYSGQEKVLRSLINQTGITHGEFVDLADVIRRTEFPETYIDDDVLNNIELIVRQHLHNINDVKSGLNDLHIPFGISVTDMTNSGIKLVAEDLRKFTAGRDPKYVSKGVAMTVLNKDELAMLTQQLSSLAGVEDATRAALKASSIPDSAETILNLDLLKQLYEERAGEHLNIMHALRNSQDHAINIRYMYQVDEAKRWFKEDLLSNMSVEQLTDLHKSYKKLLNWEAAVKEAHVADAFSDKLYKDAYDELLKNLRPGYKYNKLYTLIFDGLLDFDKMSKTQKFATLLAMREFAEVSTNSTDTALYTILYKGRWYTSFLTAQLDDYRMLMRTGFDMVAVTDATKYNTYNTMLSTVKHATTSAERLTSMVNDLTGAEALMREFEMVYGRSASGYELAYLKAISGEVYFVHDTFTSLKNALHEAAADLNDMLTSGKYNPLVVRDAEDIRNAYDRFIEDLRNQTVESNTAVLSNIMNFSDETLYAHLKGNCSGAMLIQLDAEAYEPIQEQLLNWMLHLEELDKIQLSKKDCVFNGSAHPVFVIKYIGEDSGKEVHDAIKHMQNVKLKDYYTMFPTLAENMPMSYRLSDLTPANADATRRILEFTGDSAKTANDTVQRLQHYDIYSTGFNCSVLGDVEFVRTFYPYRSSSTLSNIEQALIHNLSKLAECTYGTAILKTRQFDIKRFIAKDTTYEELAELVKNFRFVLCTLDENGKPVKATLTKDIFEEAIESKHTTYRLVPEEFFEQSLSTFEKLTTKEGYHTESNVMYAKRRISDALSQISIAYKQGALFTNTMTSFNNLLGGLMNFAADESILDAVKLAKYSSQNQVAHRIYTMLIEETTNVAYISSTDIMALYKNHPELEALLPQDLFRDWLVIKEANGSLGDAVFQKTLEAQPARLVNEAVKLNGLTLTDNELAELTDYVRKQCGELDELFNKHFSERYKEYDWTAVQKAVNEHFAKDTSRWAEIVQTVAMQYVPTRARGLDITKIAGIGKYYGLNQSLFSSVEDYLRYAITMHFMEKGHTRADAISRMLNSQFDYSSQPKLVQMLDRIAPFATYRVCNTKHWLFNVNAGANRMLSNLAQYQAVYDPMEIARVMYWTRYFEENPTDEAEDTEAPTLSPGVSKELYQSRQGKFKLPGNHYLKNTAPYFEAIELFTQVYLACIDYDAFKELLSDNIFQPIVSLGKVLDTISAGEFDAEYYLNNYYDVHGMFPVVGALFNRIFAHIKAGRANELTPADFKALFAFGESTAYDFVDATMGAIATLLPDVIGTYKDEKPVGYNWNEQSDEYKATHRFIHGVSSIPTFFTKDPAKYVDHMGMLMELGYAKEDAIELLTKGWYFDADGNVHQYSIYEDEEMPDVFKYEPEMFDNTLRYLLERGYSIDAAYTYMKTFGKWVDEDGNVRSLDDVELLWKQSVEAKQYYQIPAYIRNIPDQYSKQLQYYKSLGYTTEQARFAMTSQPIFIDADGNVQVLDNGTIYALNSAYKYNRDYETDVKLESTATQYIDNIKTPNIKALKRLVAEERVHVSGGRAHQASSYPGRYREPHSMDIRQKLYKEVYGLNNIANNRLRYAMSHSHYRSSNRYRAEMVRNIFRYL